jgi:hypothetical protein
LAIPGVVDVFHREKRAERKGAGTLTPAPPQVLSLRVKG